MNQFRLLRADEIDVRVGNTNKTKTKANLLLYKDARCDMNVLDEAVGPLNWMRSHSRDNANCTVSIWDGEKNQWISKEDTGTESDTESEKGLASDSFKRACFNWGIGRELYSAPQIWVDYNPDNDKYRKFKVLEIGYNENREINKLAVADAKTGVVVFKMGTNTNYEPIKTDPLPDDAITGKKDMPKPGTWNPRNAITLWAKHYGVTMEAFAAMRKALVAGGVVPDIPSGDLQPVEFETLCQAIQKNYPDALKVMQ